MKNSSQKTLAVLICLSLILPAGLFGASAAPKTNLAPAHDYTIISPYEDVNWDTWKALKAALHTHTIASDGAANLDEMAESHYALGYDILAITDHMVNNRGWNTVPQLVPIMTLAKKDRNEGRTVTPLTDERYQEILAGVGRGGRGMLDVPLGNELNGAVPSNTHVNGLFADYGQGIIGVDGDYTTPVREVEKRGGITFLNHLGNFTKAWDERNPDISRKPKFVNKFARIFLDYPSCVAMDINSGTDAHTGYDRILWDEVLQKTIPNGRNVSCITFSDSHGLDQNDRAFTIMMQPENTVEALKACMETGAYFGISRNAKAELGDSFEGVGPTPVVTRIKVDQSGDKITLTGTNYDNITWVSNGEIIATGETIALDAVSTDLGCYVRAYLTGPGGICYTQAFVITAPDIDWGTPYVPAVILDYSYFLRALQTVLDKVILQHSFLFKLVRSLMMGV
jgi:histidinol phosphatase-like PHP family hydrolase